MQSSSPFLTSLLAVIARLFEKKVDKYYKPIGSFEIEGTYRGFRISKSCDSDSKLL
jgi:hypothetical protein